MQDLTLVGLTQDGQKLVLVSDSGEEFTLANDAKLRAALRGEDARLGQLEKQMESALRPRDIQARIRAGETPEAVAAAAQTTLERIMSFATPVLAERAHIADRAQRASVRRKGGEGPARILGEAVAERLRTRNVDPESVEWDAWRREDGRWTLVADYRAGDAQRHAEFLFDAPGRYVVAEDDEARWLVGEATAHQPGRTGPQRRLSPVGADDELPLGSDAIELVADAEAGADEPTVELPRRTGTPRRQRALEAVDPTALSGDADWMATQVGASRPTAVPDAPAEEPVGADEPTADRPSADQGSDRERPSDDPEGPAAAGGTATAATEPSAAQRTEPEAPEAPAEQPQERPARKGSRRRGRASVPSWDEIMFGGGRSE